MMLQWCLNNDKKYKIQCYSCWIYSYNTVSLILKPHFCCTVALVYSNPCACYWYWSYDCSPVASEGCTVPAEPRTEHGCHGHGQQPNGTSEGRAEPAACPTSRCSITCTTSGMLCRFYEGNDCNVTFKSEKIWEITKCNWTLPCFI